jgi:acetylornithine deacetylase
MKATFPDIQHITRAIDENFEGQVELLQCLIRAPSLRGNECVAQEIVAGALADRGYAVERYGIDMQAAAGDPAFSPATLDYAGAFNVVGRKEPGSNTGRSLALNAHIDVVPTADPAHWRHPPFSAIRDGDWLYGRGAGDMKAGSSPTYSHLTQSRTLDIA